MADDKTHGKIKAVILDFSVWFFRESWAGIEPARGGFADLSVTTSPPGLIIFRHLL